MLLPATFRSCASSLVALLQVTNKTHGDEVKLWASCEKTTAHDNANSHAIAGAGVQHASVFVLRTFQ